MLKNGSEADDTVRPASFVRTFSRNDASLTKAVGFDQFRKRAQRCGCVTDDSLGRCHLGFVLNGVAAGIKGPSRHNYVAIPCRVDSFCATALSLASGGETL
jgi:hypothetical protein